MVLGMSLCAFCAVAGCDDGESAGLGDGGLAVNDGAATVDGPGPSLGDGGASLDAAVTPKLDGALAPMLDAAVPKPAECSAPCLTKYFGTVLACSPSGACTTSATAGGAVNACYANGVKWTLSQQLVLQMYKGMGELCFSYILDPDTGESEVVDGKGAFLGMLVENDKGESIFECDGQSFNLTTLPCGQGMQGGPVTDEASCTAGTCTVP